MLWGGVTLTVRFERNEVQVDVLVAAAAVTETLQVPDHAATGSNHLQGEISGRIVYQFLSKYDDSAGAISEPETKRRQLLLLDYIDYVQLVKYRLSVTNSQSNSQLIPCLISEPVTLISCLYFHPQGHNKSTKLTTPH